MPFNVQGAAEAQRVFRGGSMRADMNMGLWQKRKFRAFHEFTGDTTIRFTATRDFILTLQDIQLDAGQVRVSIVAGATPSGTFTDITTKFCMNTIGGDTAGFTTLAAGGTITGGTVREILRANAGGGAGAGRPGTSGTRLLGANTFYMFLDTTGTTSGVYMLEWEELDTVAGVPVP